MLLRNLINATVKQLSVSGPVGSASSVHPALGPALARMYQQYKQNHTSAGDGSPTYLFRQVSFETQ